MSGAHLVPLVCGSGSGNNGVGGGGGGVWASAEQRGGSDGGAVPRLLREGSGGACGRRWGRGRCRRRPRRGACAALARVRGGGWHVERVRVPAAGRPSSDRAVHHERDRRWRRRSERAARAHPRTSATLQPHPPARLHAVPHVQDGGGPGLRQLRGRFGGWGGGRAAGRVRGQRAPGEGSGVGHGAAGPRQQWRAAAGLPRRLGLPDAGPDGEGEGGTSGGGRTPAPRSLQAPHLPHPSSPPSRRRSAASPTLLSPARARDCPSAGSSGGMGRTYRAPRFSTTCPRTT